MILPFGRGWILLMLKVWLLLFVHKNAMNSVTFCDWVLDFMFVMYKWLCHEVRLRGIAKNFKSISQLNFIDIDRMKFFWLIIYELHWDHGNIWSLKNMTSILTNWSSYIRINYSNSFFPGYIMFSPYFHVLVSYIIMYLCYWCRICVMYLK